VIGRFAPVWEPVTPGHLFLDLTGTARLFGAAAETAARLEREVSGRYGLTGMLGVASNKLVSQAAATVVQPSQLCDVLAGCEPAFMAPLPVGSLPHLSGTLRGGRTVWQKVLGLLDDLNLRTLGDIASVPLGQLERVCGRYARLLRDRALGIDPSPVFASLQRSHLQVSGTLEPDEVDDGRILGLLYGLVERLSRQLRQQARMCTRLRLTLTHTDQEEVSGCCALRAATYWEVAMFPALQDLLYRLFQRRVRLRGLTVTADELGPSEEQLSLFDAPLSRMQRLALTVDAVRDRFGPKAIAFGRTASNEKRQDGQARNANRGGSGSAFGEAAAILRRTARMFEAASRVARDAASSAAEQREP
jgi:DNA polymerase-4